MQARLVALVTCNRAYNCAAQKQSEVVQDARLIAIISLIGQLASSEKNERGYRILQVNALHVIDRNARTTNYFTRVIRFYVLTYVRTTNGIMLANFRQFRIISRSRVKFPSLPVHRRELSPK